jgi:hypothetical protein
VTKLFEAYPKNVRAKLLALRKLIFETAAKTKGVGELEETLKWRQPSYLTTQSKSGTTIRIDHVPSVPGRYALYVNCQTNLIATFRDLYPRELTYEGNRGVIFHVDDKIPEKPLRHCIALALTYHARRATK